jgi:DNA repair photolyase
MHVAKQDPTKLVMGYKPYVKRHSFPEVRCSFWLLAWANGCMYNCAYCWLRAYHPWPWHEIHVAEKTDIRKAIYNFSKRIGGSQLLNAGELCDSFISPEYIPFMAETLRQVNEEYGRSHRLLLLTKSADPGVLLQGAYQDVVVYSVSVNTETMAKRLEHGAPSPTKRIHAAMRAKEAGYEVRVRVDPIIAGSEPAYIGLMERICAFIEPSLVTLGCLRATPRTWRFLPATVRAQLSERTPWGRGYSLETRISL